MVNQTVVLPGLPEGGDAVGRVIRLAGKKIQHLADVLPGRADLAAVAHPAIL